MHVHLFLHVLKGGKLGHIISAILMRNSGMHGLRQLLMIITTVSVKMIRAEIGLTQLTLAH